MSRQITTSHFHKSKTLDNKYVSYSARSPRDHEPEFACPVADSFGVLALVPSAVECRIGVGGWHGAVFVCDGVSLVLILLLIGQSLMALPIARALCFDFRIRLQEAELTRSILGLYFISLVRQSRLNYSLDKLIKPRV